MKAEKVTKMESNPQPSGICQRLFRLVFGALRGASALPAPPTRPIHVEGSEIAVEFNHNLRAKDGLILSDEHKEQHKGKKSSAWFKEEATSGDDKATMAMDDHDDTKTRRPRHWPLLGVASNINDKSEAFIERKKKAMIARNYSVDLDRTN